MPISNESIDLTALAKILRDNRPSAFGFRYDEDHSFDLWDDIVYDVAAHIERAVSTSAAAFFKHNCGKK